MVLSTPSKSSRPFLPACTGMCMALCSTLNACKHRGVSGLPAELQQWWNRDCFLDGRPQLLSQTLTSVCPSGAWPSREKPIPGCASCLQHEQGRTREGSGRVHSRGHCCRLQGSGPGSGGSRSCSWAGQSVLGWVSKIPGCQWEDSSHCERCSMVACSQAECTIVQQPSWLMHDCIRAGLASLWSVLPGE